MVTGDNIFTAKAIAQECGILEDNKGLVVEGKDFRTWDAVQLDRDLKHLSVMARSSPTDKLKLVQALQARRNVVAVTGDGTNDAPALHAVIICLLLVVRVHVNVTFEMLQIESDAIVVIEL
jgi:Ca2+-transporting ATPase